MDHHSLAARRADSRESDTVMFHNILDRSALQPVENTMA